MRHAVPATGRVCCIERWQVIFAGRFAVVTAAGAPAPVRCGLVSTGWWHSEGLLAVRFPVKITSDRSTQQTPLASLIERAREQAAKTAIAGTLWE